MITEDYVSFETAKLLKEKGFDELCHGYFRKDNPNDLVELAQAANWNDEPFFTSRPTLQMAMKWLREVHDAIVNVFYDKDEEKWCAEYYRMLIDDYTLIGYYSTYEEAAEAGIKCCLEYLI